MSSLIIPSNYKDKKGEIRKQYLLTKDGIKLLLSTYRGITQEQVKTCGIKDLNVIHTYTRFETSFIDMLEEALGEIDVKGVRQFNSCGKYRIDYYIPSVKLAVEYDEEFHNNQKKEDKKRELDIIKELNCRFVRLDYKKSDTINVMKVIKKIM